MFNFMHTVVPASWRTCFVGKQRLPGLSAEIQNGNLSPGAQCLQGDRLSIILEAWQERQAAWYGRTAEFGSER